MPKPNTAVRADPNAWLPCLKLISDEIVVIQVLICACAVRKFQVRREPDPSSQFLGSDTDPDPSSEILGSDTQSLILEVSFWNQTQSLVPAVSF